LVDFQEQEIEGRREKGKCRIWLLFGRQLVRIRAIQLEAGLWLAGMLWVGNFDVAEFERVGVKEKSTGP